MTSSVVTGTLVFTKRPGICTESSSSKAEFGIEGGEGEPAVWDEIEAMTTDIDYNFFQVQ